MERFNQIQCTPCPAGYYQAVENAVECGECAAGKYQDLVGGAKCKACAAGKYAAENGPEKWDKKKQADWCAEYDMNEAAEAEAREHRVLQDG